MSQKRKEYYTAGELAELFHLPKQTLLYYDKTGILSPEFISENNYRHYSMKQYLILEIILNMRKLNIPINKIKKYLQNRNETSFAQLLLDKEKECLKTIEENQKILNDIQLVLKHLNKMKHSHLGQITLTFRKAKQFLMTPVDSNISGTEIIDVLAQHNLKVFSKEHFREKAVGWILSQNDFFKGIYGKPKAFFSTPNPLYHEQQNIVIRPEGLYATIRFQGILLEHTQELSDLFNDFLVSNRLKAVDDIYVITLKDHWLTDDIKEYISQISLRVESLDKE